MPACKGMALHDSHAEILALRGLNRFLLELCHALLKSDPSEADISGDEKLSFVKMRKANQSGTHPNFPQPFELDPSVAIYLYCTEAPCGDASMEVVMAAQADPTPWKPRSADADTATSEPREDLSSRPKLPGRANFSELSIVRRKPARPDAPPTLSKSCSDKLALKQFTSALSHTTSLLIAPTENTWLKALVLPESRYSAVGAKRAFGTNEAEGGRLAHILPAVSPNQCGYWYRGFEILTVGEDVMESYPFTRPLTTYVAPLEEQSGSLDKADTMELKSDSQKMNQKAKLKVSNVSAAWVAAPRQSTPCLEKTTTASAQETLINGLKQGYSAYSKDDRRASCLARRSMWLLTKQITKKLASRDMTAILEAGSYQELKCIDFIKSDVDVLDSSDGKALNLHGMSRAGIKNLVIGASQSERSPGLEGGTRGLRGWIKNVGDDGWNLETAQSELAAAERRMKH